MTLSPSSGCMSLFSDPSRRRLVLLWSEWGFVSSSPVVGVAAVGVGQAVVLPPRRRVLCAVGGRRCRWSRLVLWRRRRVRFFLFFFSVSVLICYRSWWWWCVWPRFWRFRGDGSLLCFLFPVTLSTQSVVALLLLLVVSVLQAKPSFHL